MLWYICSALPPGKSHRAVPMSGYEGVSISERFFVFQKFLNAKLFFFLLLFTMNKVSPANSASPISQLTHAGVWPGVAIAMHRISLPSIHSVPSSISWQNCSPVVGRSEGSKLYFSRNTDCTCVTFLPILTGGWADRRSREVKKRLVTMWHSKVCVSYPLNIPC